MKEKDFQYRKKKASEVCMSDQLYSIEVKNFSEIIKLWKIKAISLLFSSTCLISNKYFSSFNQFSFQLKKSFQVIKHFFKWKRFYNKQKNIPVNIVISLYDSEVLSFYGFIIVHKKTLIFRKNFKTIIGFFKVTKTVKLKWRCF